MRRVPDADTVVGAVYLALGLFVIFVLIPLGVDEPDNVEFAALAPSYWPRVICVVLVLLGLGMLLRRRSEPRGDAEPEAADGAGGDPTILRVGAVIAGTFVLHFALETLGFALAGFLALALLMRLAGERRPLRIAIVSVAVPLGLHFFFTKVAGIPIPAGVLEPILA